MSASERSEPARLLEGGCQLQRTLDITFNDLHPAISVTTLLEGQLT